jgi:very-short-patch-repair endonuclease
MPQPTGRARDLRRAMTEAEKRLWNRLRNRQLCGIKFKRQVPMDRYIVDFVSAEAKLIIELDGSQHADSKRDVVRDRRLESMGYLVLRLWNNDVLTNTDGVLETIARTVDRLD